MRAIEEKRGEQIQLRAFFIAGAAIKFLSKGKCGDSIRE